MTKVGTWRVGDVRNHRLWLCRMNDTMLIDLDLEARRQERVESLNQRPVAMEERGNTMNHPWSINAATREHREGI